MRRTLFSIVLFTIGVLLVNCSNNSGEVAGTGKLSVSLTDAPFPHDLVAEANVTVFKVEARHKGELPADMPEMQNSDIKVEDDVEIHEEDGSSFVVLMEKEVDVNLLELTNGVTESLVSTDVPSGTYDLVRVYVKGVNVVMTDGTTYDLKMPSGSQSGIKVFLKPGIEVNGGLSADLLLDFDVSKSFVAKGSSDTITGFNFKPVIKASNLSTSGTLTGVVSETKEEAMIGLEGAQVAVFAADTLNTTTFTDVDERYMVMGLDAGSYSLKIEKDGYDMQSIENIDITAANKTEQNIELTAVE